MTCNRCNVPYEAHELECLECPVCRQTSKIMILIMCKWNLPELAELAKLLRDKTVQMHLKDAQASSAWVLLRLCRLIRHLGHPLEIGEEGLKRRVCEGIHDRIKSEEANVNYARKQGITMGQLALLQAGSIKKFLQEAGIR